MGYTTSHVLRLINSNIQVEDILKSEEDFPGLDYAIDENGDYYESVKWYDHEEDMRILSGRYPDVIFALEGEGMNQGDHWFEYYKNGKMQRCNAIVSFDEYDETKLT